MNDVTLTLTREEAELVWGTLKAWKCQMTKDGRIWSKHGMNAQIRTKIENALAEGQ